MFIGALGLYWKGKYRGILEGILNLGLSIVLGYKLGLMGVIIGTFVSSVVVGLIFEPYILCKYGFKTSIWFILVPVIEYSICMVGVAIITKIIIEAILAETLKTTVGLMVKFTATLFVYVFIMFIMWKNKPEYKRVINRICVMIKNRINNERNS